MSLRWLLIMFGAGFALSGAPWSDVAAKEPPPAILGGIDEGVDGEEVRRAAEALVDGYRDHPRVGEASEILADYHYMLGEYKAAAHHYEAAAKASSGTARVRQLLGRGRSLIGARDFRTAISVFDEVLRSDPQSTAARLGLADAANLGGDGPQAATLYGEILTRSPNDPLAPLALAQRIRVLDSLGRSAEALADARRLIESYPRSTEAASARDRLREKEPGKAPGSPAQRGKTAAETQSRRVPDAGSGDQKRKSAPTSPRETAPRETTPRETAPRENEPVAGGYSLQLGAFGNEPNAQELARKLEGLGMEEVRVEDEARGGRIFYRVRCGNYGDPEEAAAEGRRLQENQGLRSQVVAR